MLDEIKMSMNHSGLSLALQAARTDGVKMYFNSTQYRIADVVVDSSTGRTEAKLERVFPEYLEERSLSGCFRSTWRSEA